MSDQQTLIEEIHSILSEIYHNAENVFTNTEYVNTIREAIDERNEIFKIYDRKYANFLMLKERTDVHVSKFCGHSFVTTPEELEASKASYAVITAKLNFNIEYLRSAHAELQQALQIWKIKHLSS